MKNGLILLLIVLLALTALGRDNRPVAAIQDTSLLHHAAAEGAALAQTPYQTCQGPTVPAFLVNPNAKRIA